MQNEQYWSHELLRSYPEVVKYLLRKYTADQAIVEYDAAILRYTQPANMNAQLYAEELIAKSCMVAIVYSKGTLNNVLIERVDKSIYHSLRNYSATNPQGKPTDIAFQSKLLLAIQKVSGKQLTVGQQSLRPVGPYEKL